MLTQDRVVEIPGTIKLLDYCGPVDYEVIDRLLEELREKTMSYNLSRVTAKRTYAIVVECLENIIRYADANTGPDDVHMPSLAVLRNAGKITVRTGNLVTEQKAGDIKKRLDLLNGLDDRALNEMFEHEINKETDYREPGARLGFIMIKTKSGNKIEYDFDVVEGHRIYFKLDISINE